MATAVSERIKTIMEQQMGEFGEFILRKQCYELFVMPEELEQSDLFDLSKGLADAVKLFGGEEKAKKVSRQILKLIDLEIIEKQEDVNEKTRWLRSTGDTYKSIGGWEVATKFYKQALELSEDVANYSESAKIYRNMGAIKRRQGKWGLSLELLDKSLMSARKANDLDEQARTFQGMGRVHWRKSEYQKAIHYYTQCIEMCVQTKNKTTLGYILLDLGRVYDEMGEHDQAISNLQMGLALLKEEGDEQGVAKVYNKLGCVYGHKGDLDKAFHAYDVSLKQAHISGFMALQALIQANAGEWYARNGDFDTARKYCDDSFEVFQKFNDRFGLSYATMSYAILYTRQENWKDAEYMFEDCIRHREFIGTPYAIAECYMEYGMMLSEKSDKKRAKKNLERALKLFKRLRNQYMNEKIADELAKLR